MPRGITVTGPLAGQVVYTGDTLSITWSASADIGMVDIHISYDDGEEWSTLLPLGGIAAGPGVYRWPAPLSVSPTTTALVRVFPYTEGVGSSAAGHSGLFTIETSVSAVRKGASSVYMGISAIHGNARVATTGSRRICYSLRTGDRARLAIFRADGSLISVIELAERAGMNEVLWDGRDTQGRIVGAGMYMVQLRVR